MGRYRKKTFNAKIQYAMDKKKHEKMLTILKQKGINLAVFVRQKIDRLDKVNSHINLTYEQKVTFLKHLDKEGLSISQWMDNLADELISSQKEENNQ